MPDVTAMEQIEHLTWRIRQVEKEQCIPAETVMYHCDREGSYPNETILSVLNIGRLKDGHEWYPVTVEVGGTLAFCVTLHLWDGGNYTTLTFPASQITATTMLIFAVLFGQPYQLTEERTG
jgi:hypothetical protein